MELNETTPKIYYSEIKLDTITQNNFQTELQRDRAIRRNTYPKGWGYLGLAEESRKVNS